MKSTVEPINDDAGEDAAAGSKVRLTVTVDEAELEVALDAAFKRIAREVRVPGFRPGKVPRRVLEARLGPGVARQEALRDALPGYYAEAVKEHEVDVIAAPEITITSGEEEGPVTFDATVEVRPVLQLEGYGGLTITVPRPDVTDEDVDRQLDRLRSADAELTVVERPAQAGDVLTIDLLASQDHEDHVDTLDDVQDYTYEIGAAPGFPPEVDEQLTGAGVGEERTFDATVGEGDEARTIHFAITVKQVQEKQLPELTDEWVAEASELETVEALREDLRTRLQQGRTQAVRAALRDSTVAAVSALVDDALVPEALVSEEVQRRAQELDQTLRRQGADLTQYAQAVGGAEVVLGQLRGQALPAVKADLALRAVAEAEELGCTDEELDEELEKLAPQLGQSAAQLRRALERNDGVQAVRSDVRKAKALEWLMEHVEVKDQDGHPVDRAAILAVEQEHDGDSDEATTEEQD
jgi:trigger factor